MYRLFFIAKNNIKKQKGDMITFFILTFLAAFLIYNCSSTLDGMGKVMDDRFSEMNGAHELLFVGDSEEENECAKRAFEENEHIVEYEATPCTITYAEYKNKKDDEWKEYQFITESFGADKKMMKVLDVDASKLSENDIFVPFYLKGNFAIGDTLQIKLSDDIYDFNVAGYSEDPYFSSSMNVTVYYVYISQKMTDKLVDEHPDLAAASMVYKGRVDESEFAPLASNAVSYIMSANDTGDYYTTTKLEEEVTGRYNELITKYSEKNPEKNYLRFLAVNWQTMRGGAQFIPMVAMAMIFMFAVLILIIAIIIISFSIKNFIQRNMKNTGILEASGYTVSELRAAITLQMALAALIGSVIGVVTAVLTGSSFGVIVSMVLGLTWKAEANISIAVFTVVSLILLILLVTRLVSRKYKKITVLDALRGGINTHNFKRNHFSFEKTPLPISLVLSLKETVGEAGKNVVLALIISVLTISTLLGLGSYENFGADPDSLLKIMGFDSGTIMIDGDESIEDEINKLDGVENILIETGFEPSVSKGDMSKNVYTYIFKDMERRTNTVMLEGRYAKHDNEIMVTAGVADDFGVKIGDMLTITMGEKSEDYMICGIDQRMERMGRVISMTFDGAKKLSGTLPTLQYLVTGKEGVTFEDFDKQIDKLVDEGKIGVKGTADVDKNMRGSLYTINMAMKLLCMVITVITLLVVVFVEALLIRAKIVREWRSFGISKALGMTSGQIIAQIMTSNMPGILLGTVVGILLSGVTGSKLCVMCFSIFNMKKVSFSVSPMWDIITMIGIVAVAVITAGLFGLRTRKLQPVNMITEE